MYLLPPPTMEKLYNKLVELRLRVMAEDAKRNELKKSSEYLALAEQILALTEKQQEILDDVPNSSSLYEMAKKTMFDLMIKQNLREFGDAKVKYKVKKEVNKEKLVKVLEGDWDLIKKLANFTQKDLIEHAKGNAHESELLSCIEIVSEEPTDLSL